jgi:hypothetical protein
LIEGTRAVMCIVLANPARLLRSWSGNQCWFADADHKEPFYSASAWTALLCLVQHDDQGEVRWRVS